MKFNSPLLSRRTFGALAMSVLPAATPLNRVADRHAQFVRDVTRSYELQFVAFDMEDANVVFRGARDQVLGVGVASRAVLAAKAATQDAGRLGNHSLVVIAVTTGEGRFRDYKLAYNSIRDNSLPNSTIIYAACDDPELPPGNVRVSLLTG